MQIIAVDTGRDKTKIATYNKKISIKSIVGDWHIRNLSNGGDYEVIINGENYFVSDLAERESYAPRKMTTKSKIHEETKILFLTAIGLISEEVRPYIITGVPVDQFNPDVKQEMLTLLKGEYYIKINGQSKHIIIDDFTIAPEGGGAFYYALSQFPFLEKNKVRIIDIGSRTINHICVNDKIFINKDSGTLNYGSLILEESTLTHEQFASKIIADLSKRWLEFNQKNDIVLLTGGGSIQLERWLKPQFPNCRIVDEPIFANVLGYLKMGEMKWQKQTAR